MRPKTERERRLRFLEVYASVTGSESTGGDKPNEELTDDELAEACEACLAEPDLGLLSSTITELSGHNREIKCWLSTCSNAGKMANVLRRWCKTGSFYKSRSEKPNEKRPIEAQPEFQAWWQP